MRCSWHESCAIAIHAERRSGVMPLLREDPLSCRTARRRWTHLLDKHHRHSAGEERCARRLYEVRTLLQAHQRHRGSGGRRRDRGGDSAATRLRLAEASTAPADKECIRRYVGHAGCVTRRKVIERIDSPVGIAIAVPTLREGRRSFGRCKRSRSAFAGTVETAPQLDGRRGRDTAFRSSTGAQSCPGRSNGFRGSLN